MDTEGGGLCRRPTPTLPHRLAAALIESHVAGMKTFAAAGALLTLAIALAIALAIVAANPVAAQDGRIAVTVVDEVSGAPIAGATVEFHDPEGRRIRGGFTGQDGRIVVDLPHHPRIEILSERIGYARRGTGLIPWERAIGGIELSLSTHPVALPGIEATGDRRCEGEAADGARIWRVWSDARTALRATLLTEEEELVRFRAESWVQDLTAAGEVRQVRERTSFITARQPFHTLDPELLARDGYIQVEGDTITHFYGPDARALLSDAFIDTHCFTLEEGTPGTLDLRFTPVPGRDVPDIQGVLRITDGSHELREVIYEYVAARAARDDLGGGHIRFRPLEQGPWIVDQWSIRMPLGTSRLRVWLFGSPVEREAGGVVREVIEVPRPEVSFSPVAGRDRPTPDARSRLGSGRLPSGFGAPCPHA